MTVRIGVAFDGFVTTGEAIALARHAVEAGAKSLWVAEHLGYREAITTCAAFALSAPGPMLVPTAVSPYLFHPTPTAMALATLDELAPGRVAVALGVGNPMFLQESGQKLEKPLRAMREFITALRKLWSTEPAHLDGEFVRLAGARLAFKPNPIPIYVAAMGPDMLQLTGRIADGIVLSAGLSTEFECGARSISPHRARPRRDAIPSPCAAPATSSSDRRTTRARPWIRCAASSPS